MDIRIEEENTMSSVEQSYTTSNKLIDIDNHVNVKVKDDINAIEVNEHGRNGSKVVDIYKDTIEESALSIGMASFAINDKVKEDTEKG